MQHSPAVSLSRSDIARILAGLLLAMLLASLDQTIVATAMPTIGRELGHPDQLPWLVTAYLLAATAVTPLYGKLSDIHGRRIVLLTAIAIFLVGSLLCALSPSLLILALSRAVQGAGGGGLISLAQTIIGDLLPPRERVRYQVHIASVFIVSSAAGPVLGGLLSEHVHWTAIFWINLPLGLIAWLVSHRQLKRLPRVERPHRLDVAGALLLIAATSSLLLGLNWGGVHYAWGSPEIWGIFAACLALWIGFGLRMHLAQEPLIPLTLLADRTVLGATLAASFSLGAFVGPSVFTPIFFQSMLGLSATGSGGALMPLMLGPIVGATLSGRAMIHIRHYKIVPIAGLCLSCAAAVTLALRPSGLPLPVICALQGAVGVGLGTVLSVATISIQNAVAPHQLGTALSASNLFRQLGAALGVAVCGAILGGAGIAGAAHADAGAVHLLAADAAALIGGYRLIFVVTAIATLGALLALLLIEELPLRGAEEGQNLGGLRPRAK